MSDWRFTTRVSVSASACLTRKVCEESGPYRISNADSLARPLGQRPLQSPGAGPRRSRRCGSLWQLSASLLRHHVRGVPVGPVLVALPGSLFVLSVGGLRTPKRTRQIVRRRESRRCGVDATGQPRRDLLQHPAVAVRIMERGERAVAAMLGIRTADPAPPE